MVLRAALAAAVLLSTAPIQCGHTPDAELREDETPGDALWALAQRFKAGGDTAGERRTLEYLVERYPASRWIGPAKEELASLSGSGGGGAEARGAGGSGPRAKSAGGGSGGDRGDGGG
jgi:hypothetical protein